MHNDNINKYPILGRVRELKMYLEMLKERHRKYKNEILDDGEGATGLLIRGEARQGLTRVLDEIIYITPAEIPVNRFLMIKNDLTVSIGLLIRN